MSHFYGSMQGSRGEATRCGTKNSGFTAHIRGRDIGVEVWLRYDEKKKRDVVEVQLTGRSNGRRVGRHLGTFYDNS